MHKYIHKRLHACLHSPGRCDFGQIFAHRLDDTAAPHPQSYGNPHTPEDQHPERSWRLLLHALFLRDHPKGNQGADSIAGKRVTQGYSEGQKTKYAGVFIHRATKGSIELLKYVLHKITVKGWKTKFVREITDRATALLEKVLLKVAENGGRLNSLHLSPTGQ